MVSLNCFHRPVPPRRFGESLIAILYIRTWLLGSLILFCVFIQLHGQCLVDVSATNMNYSSNVTSYFKNNLLNSYMTGVKS